MAFFFNNPPGYPAPVGEVTPQPLFALDQSNTGYMDEAQRSGAVLTKGDQPVIVAPMRVAPPVTTYNGTDYVCTDDESRAVERLSAGLPLFVMPKDAYNGCVNAASLHDVNALLYKNRSVSGYNVGQLIAREFRYIGVLSTKMDPTHGLMNEGSRGSHSAYAQQDAIEINVIAGGTTPGVTPLGCNSISQFPSGKSVIDPAPCSPHLSGARMYLVLMPTTAAFVRGEVSHPYPTAQQLTHFVSARTKISQSDKLGSDAGDNDDYAESEHTTIPSEKDVNKFFDLSKDPDSPTNIGAYTPPLGEKGVRGDVCYQIVPYLTSMSDLPHKTQFLAWAGSTAPDVEIILGHVTSVDNSAMHGATHSAPVAHELIHPTTTPTKAVFTQTIQAGVCM